MSTTNPYPCVADRPEVSTFVDSLPADPERDRLAAEYRRLTAAYLASGQRANVIRPRIEDIVDALIDATGKQRDTLLAEYVTLGAELDLLPKLRSQVAWQYAEALSAWARYVRGQVVQEYDQAATEIGRLTTALSAPELRVFRLDQSTGLRDANQAEYAQAQQDVSRIRAEMRPHLARQAEARQVQSFIEITLNTYFGDATRSHGVQPEAIDRFVRHIEKLAA